MGSPAARAAEVCGLVKPQLTQNWLTAPDLANLLYLADFETIRISHEIMWPVRTPGIDTLCNRYLVKLWPFRELGITNFLIARPSPNRARGRSRWSAWWFRRATKPATSPIF